MRPLPPPQDLASYTLLSSQSAHIFTTQILPLDILPHAQSPNPSAPLAILTVGQTGAGKSHLTPALLAALAAVGRDPAHLVADLYKAHHPEYRSLPPPLASPATGPDARRWLAMAVAAAAERRLDLLLESACRHPDDFTQLAKTLADAGYRLLVIILAVPAALSRLGLLARFHHATPEEARLAELPGRLPLRLTPAKVHDDSYAGLLDVARWLDSSGVAERILIVRRGNLAAYLHETGREVSLGNRKGGAMDALLVERQRPLTADESAVAQTDLEALSAVHGAEEQLIEVRQLLEPLLKASSDETVDEAERFPRLRPLEFTVSFASQEDISDDVLRLVLAPY